MVVVESSEGAGPCNLAELSTGRLDQIRSIVPELDKKCSTTFLISCWVSGPKAPPPNNTLVLGDWIPSLFRLLYKASLSRLDLEHSSKTCLVSRAMLR